MKPQRSSYLFTALGLVGVPYIWGGKDPGDQVEEIDRSTGKLVRSWTRGLDCSGLVTHVLWRLGGPDWRQTHNTDRLWDELPETHAPQPGDICLYGLGGSQPNPSHVMLWLGACGVVFGATGGNSDTKTHADAKRHDARVKFKTSHLYRADFLGFRSMPLT
jgi:murein DD-endopeptidase